LRFLKAATSDGPPSKSPTPPPFASRAGLPRVGLVGPSLLGQTVVLRPAARPRSDGTWHRTLMTRDDGIQAILLLVELFIHPDRAAEFRRFETEAARIMRRHGGQIERVIRPTDRTSGDPLPHEIHIVSFSSAAGFDRYRSDPELVALAPLRESAIARTQVTVGTEGEAYPEAPA
jgi:hypothetical protein